MIAALGVAALLATSACALRIGGDSIGEILAREKGRLPPSRDMVPSPREMALLRKVLAAFDLPGDHAELSVFDQPAQGAAAGAVGHVYVTSGLLRDFRQGTLPEAQLVAVLAHEVAHMVLGHPMRTASPVQLAVVYESDPFALANRAYALAIARKAKPDADALSLFAHSAQIQHTLMPTRQGEPPVLSVSPEELAAATLYPLYRYPLESELEADVRAGKSLAALGYPATVLADFLERQLEYLPDGGRREWEPVFRKRIGALKQP